MIRQIPEMIKAGVTSLKIEGRAKSAYYVSVITNAYRLAVDWCMEHPDQPVPQWIVDEADKISHRPYSTGFYLGGEPGQETVHGGYIRNGEVLAVCEGREGELLILSNATAFSAGKRQIYLNRANSLTICHLTNCLTRKDSPLRSLRIR